MEVQTIKTEAGIGEKIDRVRDVERLYLEVEAVGNGCGIEGYKIPGETKNEDGTLSRQRVRIEIYADRLGFVLSRTREDKHRRAWEQAEESARILTDEWIREHKAEYNRKKELGKHHEYVRLGSPHHASIELTRLGYRTGIPPLDVCNVVHPKTGATMDAREFSKLDADKRREWTLPAYTTHGNAQARQGEAFVQGMRELLADMKGANKREK